MDIYTGSDDNPIMPTHISLDGWLTRCASESFNCDSGGFQSLPEQCFVLGGGCC